MAGRGAGSRERTFCTLSPTSPGDVSSVRRAMWGPGQREPLPGLSSSWRAAARPRSPK